MAGINPAVVAVFARALNYLFSMGVSGRPPAGRDSDSLLDKKAHYNTLSTVTSIERAGGSAALLVRMGAGFLDNNYALRRPYHVIIH